MRYPSGSPVVSRLQPIGLSDNMLFAVQTRALEYFFRK
jgi:hypothetical protein